MYIAVYGELLLMQWRCCCSPMYDIQNNITTFILLFFVVVHDFVRRANAQQVVSIECKRVLNLRSMGYTKRSINKFYFIFPQKEIYDRFYINVLWVHILGQHVLN